MFSSIRDRLFVSIALGVLAGDIVTKRLAESSLPLHIPQPVIGDVVRWTLTYNTGAAMNMHLGASSRVIFSLVAIVMIAIIVKMWRGLPPTSTWLAASLGMIVAGAAGNLLDRLRSARGVVDFIDVGIGSARFWTFNVADSGVTVGAIILAILTWREPVAADAAAPKDEDAPPPA
ncbi:MAG: signal peptidase II [Gemmatimonadaceae bacterium]|nr:signal peptidase II [Gemmatimonadaceae bacterium]